MQKVQIASEYFRDLLFEISKAEKSVYLQSMLFESGDKIGEIESKLISAADRGLDVRVHYDWVAGKYVHSDLPFFPEVNKEKRDYASKIHEKNNEMYARLIKAGVKLEVTNDPSFLTTQFPYLGRNHIKMAVIDNKISWVGGVNLFDDAFENIDIMVKSDKAQLTAALVNQFYKINENTHHKDYKVKIDNLETLYVDTGRKGKSIIFDTARKRIGGAKNNIVFMSQFVPDTKVLKEINKAALKGVKTTIFTSPKNNEVFNRYPEKLSYIVLKNSIEEQDNIKLYHLKRKVHAKLIIIDGVLALYGSHNYTYSGVLFGTEEIMVETKENKILEELKSFIKSNSGEAVDAFGA